MEAWRICGLAVLSAVAFSLVRQMGRDFEVPMKLTASVVFWGLLVTMAVPLVTYVREMVDGGVLGEYGAPLLAALGVAMLSGICADVCRECRENGLALYVETAGRLEILLLCVPLIRDILETVGGLIGA